MRTMVFAVLLLVFTVATAGAAGESVVRDLPDTPVGPGDEVTVGLTQDGFFMNVVLVREVLPEGFVYVDGSYTGSRAPIYYTSNNTLYMEFLGSDDVSVTYDATTGTTAQIRDGRFNGWYDGMDVELDDVDGAITGDDALTPDTGELPQTGDINNDDYVRLSDAIYLAKHVAGMSGYETIYADGDINNDGYVKLSDAIYLAKHVAGMSGYETLYPGA